MLTHPYERYDDTQYDPFDERVVVRRGPHPGIAAVLSVVIPGLGQVYNGRLLAGAMWFLLTTFGYAAILVPGFLFHVASVWCAYQGARRWTGY